MDVSYEELHDLYITQRITLKSLSHRFNVPMEVVYAKLLDYDIDTSRIQPSIRSVLDYKSYFYTNRYKLLKEAIFKDRDYICSKCGLKYNEEDLRLKQIGTYRYSKYRYNEEYVTIVCKKCNKG